MHQKYLAALIVALALAGPSVVHAADDAKALRAQASAAYDRGDLAGSAALYEQAIAAAPSAALHHDLSFIYALLGQTEKAFAQLDLAIAAGYSSSTSLIRDSDFDSLKPDPRWQAALDRIDRLHPEQPLQRLLEDDRKPVPTRYFPVRRALANGLAPPPRATSSFMDYYAPLATMMGEYDEARALYARPGPPLVDPVALGFSQAVPANAVILEKARGRQAVFLNESHAESQTRAANYTLLAPLRKQGFKYLALEALMRPEPEPAGDTACAALKLHDVALPTRGYPVQSTGYYTQDPVFGELLREAIRLGYTLVSYDGGGNRGPREQHQARMLQCIFTADPKAKLLVIAGFSHIAEGKDHSWAGGMMAYRFKALTGIDPLTVNTSGLLSLDPARLQFPKNDAGRGAQSYALLNADQAAYGNENFDLMVYTRHPAHRNDNKGSWLELGGDRKRTPITAAGCHGKVPCLLEARARGEGDDAIPSDRCVIGRADAPGCNLYLRPGQYQVVAMDEMQAELDRGGITVP